MKPDDLTRVRAKRSMLIHVTIDGRRTLCNRPCDGFVIEPDTAVTCERCRDAVEFN